MLLTVSATSQFEIFRSSRPAVLCNFIEITLWHGCSPVNLLHIFRTLFPENTSGRLLLNIFCEILLTKLNVAEYQLFYTVTTRFSVKVFSNRIVHLLLTNSCILEYQLLLLHKVFLTLTVTP